MAFTFGFPWVFQRIPPCGLRTEKGNGSESETEQKWEGNSVQILCFTLILRPLYLRSRRCYDRVICHHGVSDASLMRCDGHRWRANCISPETYETAGGGCRASSNPSNRAFLVSSLSGRLPLPFRQRVARLHPGTALNPSTAQRPRARDHPIHQALCTDGPCRRGTSLGTTLANRFSSFAALGSHGGSKAGGRSTAPLSPRRPKAIRAARIHPPRSRRSRSPIRRGRLSDAAPEREPPRVACSSSSCSIGAVRLCFPGLSRGARRIPSPCLPNLERLGSMPSHVHGGYRREQRSWLASVLGGDIGPSARTLRPGVARSTTKPQGSSSSSSARDASPRGGEGRGSRWRVARRGDLRGARRPRYVAFRPETSAWRRENRPDAAGGA